MSLGQEPLLAGWVDKLKVAMQQATGIMLHLASHSKEAAAAVEAAHKAAPRAAPKVAPKAAPRAVYQAAPKVAPRA